MAFAQRATFPAFRQPAPGSGKEKETGKGTSGTGGLNLKDGTEKNEKSYNAGRQNSGSLADSTVFAEDPDWKIAAASIQQD